MKVVLNGCYGGFSLSIRAREMLHCGRVDYLDDRFRTDPKLVEVVRFLGAEANGRSAKLKIVEIPDDVTDWEIQEYDGIESIIAVRNGKLEHYSAPVQF